MNEILYLLLFTSTSNKYLAYRLNDDVYKIINYVFIKEGTGPLKIGDCVSSSRCYLFDQPGKSNQDVKVTELSKIQIEEILLDIL